jgi:hypothetical protein
MVSAPSLEGRLEHTTVRSYFVLLLLCVRFITEDGHSKSCADEVSMPGMFLIVKCSELYVWNDGRHKMMSANFGQGQVRGSQRTSHVVIAIIGFARLFWPVNFRLAV